MGFGVEDHYTEDYIEYLKTREYVITRWKNSNFKRTVRRINVHLKSKYMNGIVYILY